MKARFVFFLPLIFCFKLNAQFSVKENVSIYSGNSNFIFENTKSDRGYYYNLVLNDSLKIADTIFRNSGVSSVSMIIHTSLTGKLKWFLSMPGFFSEKPFKLNDKVAQIVYFSDSIYTVGGNSIQNTAREKCYGIVSIDTGGQNLSLIKIGNEIKSSPGSKLTINCLTYNSSGNIVISGYQNGAVNIGGQTFQSDSVISTYFIAEMNNSGVLINYKPLFYTESIYFLSRGIEFEDKLIFETGFDSISILNKSYNALFILNQKVNDVALIVLNKNTQDIRNYKVLQDSSSNNSVPGNGIICNSHGILWPINSTTNSIRLNDSVISINRIHKQVYLLLENNTIAYKKHFLVSTELDGSTDIDIFGSDKFIMTFRYAGKFVKINNDSIPIPTDPGTTAFIVLNAANVPKLVFSVRGQANAVRLTEFSDLHLEIWVNYFASNSNLIAKNETLNRNANHLNWKYQLTHYSFDNFSSIRPISSDTYLIYPNPCSEVLKIKNYPEDNYEVHIYNSVGQLTAKYYNESEMNISNISEGIYFVELISNGKSLVGQIILVQAE